MKATLDLDKLLKEQEITQREYDKFGEFAQRSTGSLAYGILLGFGVIAASAGAYRLIGAEMVAILVGLILLVTGLAIWHVSQDWGKVLASMFVLTGALMASSGILEAGEGSRAAILGVTLLLAASGVLARSGLLVVFATLMLSTSIGAGADYRHASYFLMVQDPTITIVLFGILAVGLHYLSKILPTDFARLAIIASRTSVFLVNFGFWVGSLWGERSGEFLMSKEVIPDTVFSVVWGIALLATGIWAWLQSQRWILNTVAIFGGIHFYTQWFERLGSSPGYVLLAGILALGFAASLRAINQMMYQTPGAPLSDSPIVPPPIPMDED